MISDRVPDLLETLLRDKIIYVKKRRFTGIEAKKENFHERKSAADQLETALKLGMFNYRRNRWKFEIITATNPNVISGVFSMTRSTGKSSIKGTSLDYAIVDELHDINNPS